MKVEFYERCQIEDKKLMYAVVVSNYRGSWLFVRHKARTSWEIPGGRREYDEPIIETAHRELFEETGALKYVLTEVCDYSVNGDSPDYGRVYFAEIAELGQLPFFEIAARTLSTNLPDQMTYPDIQSQIFEKVLAIRERGHLF